jgi:hypothetical protein
MSVVRVDLLSGARPFYNLPVSLELPDESDFTLSEFIGKSNRCPVALVFQPSGFVGCIPFRIPTTLPLCHANSFFAWFQFLRAEFFR